MPSFTVDGTSYDVDLDHITTKELRLLKEHAGLTVAALAAGYLQGDVDAIQGVVFLAKRRAGEAVRWRDLDDLDVMAIVEQIAGHQFKIMGVALGPAARWVDRLRAVADDIEADQERAPAEPDPTTPAEQATSTG